MKTILIFARCAVLTLYCKGIFTTASTNLIYAQNFMALIALYHGNLVIKTWMTFVVYQVFNLITAGIVMFANFAIPALNRFSRKSLDIPLGISHTKLCANSSY